MGMKQQVKRSAAGMDELKTNVCDIISKPGNVPFSFDAAEHYEIHMC